MTDGNDAAWERLWAPYDEATYERALAFVRPGSVVLDIGAGDLRLTRRLAQIADLVYALENQPALLDQPDLPSNLVVVCADAVAYPFPTGIDTAVLLMRHCRHFGLYVDKLTDVGCRRLITNARWRLGVEVIDLTEPAREFNQIAIGWYACRCGSTGFVPGPVEWLTPDVERTINEVSSCPGCRDYGRHRHRLT